MQTFVPEDTFTAIGVVLDRQRLGKQRVECLQLLNANLGLSRGWTSHPAAVMWRGHEAGLCAYGIAMCEEWVRRGYQDTCRAKMEALVAPDANDLPRWWGDAAVILSHRSNLVRKMPEHYGALWAVPDDLPYVWPVP